MTILQVEHATTYRYRRAVELGEHRLMLRPRDSHDLRLLKTELSCSPPAQLTWSHDVFGNSVAHAAFGAPADTLKIVSRIRVEQCAPDWPVFDIADFAQTYPFAYSPDERADLGALLEPQYVDPEGRLRTWAQGFIHEPAPFTLSLLQAINTGLSGWAFYQSREDEHTQGPLETLKRGWGTCRDFAVLFVEAVRTLGFGARLASGYLYVTDATIGSHGAGSTHAWAEVYVPGAGWIAFDPTNRTMGGSNLIRVAVARNIAQVSPIAGSFVGVPDDFLGMDVSVSVTPALQAARAIR